MWALERREMLSSRNVAYPLICASERTIAPNRSVEPGQSTSVTLSLRCLSRDCFDLNRLQGGSTFPSGLVKSGRKSQTSDRLVVYPKVTEIHDLVVPHSRNHQPVVSR